MDIIVLCLLIILILKIYSLKEKNVVKSFSIFFASDLLFLGIGINSFLLSCAIFHIETQIIFKGILFLILLNLISFGKNFENLKGSANNYIGVILGFFIIASLGVFINTKSILFSAISEIDFNLGFLLVIIFGVELFYFIRMFENLVLEGKKEKISLNLYTYLAILVGLVSILFKEIYYTIPNIIHPIPHFSFKFNFSGINGLFSFLFMSIIGFVFLYSIDFIDKRKKEYFIFLGILAISLIFLPASSNIESFYFFFELMTISSYMLILHPRGNSIYAARIYLLMCMIGAYLINLGFGYILDREIITISVAITLFLGFAFKAGLFPMHYWLVVAHPAAPSSISAPLSGILTKAGVLGIIILIYGFNIKSVEFSYLITILGIITLFYGEIKSLTENDIKRLFAYSTIGQIGEIITILGIMNALALSGAIYHIINHAIVKDLLFLSAGILILSAGSKTLDDLQGIGKKLPVLAFPLGVGIFAISALPPFGNFNSKFLMIYSAIKANNLLSAFSLIIGSLIGFIAMIRVFKIIFLLPAKKEFNYVGGIKLWVVYILSIISLLLGLFPKEIVQFINSATLISFNISINPSILDINVPLSVFIITLGAILVYIKTSTAKEAGLVSASFAFLALLVSLNFNSIGNIFAFLTLFMAILNFIYAAKYMDKSHKVNRFFANFLIMIAGIVGVSLSNNIFSMLFYWEIMGGWALYLALVHEEDDYSIKEATKYLIYNFAGAGIIMVGIAIIMQYGVNFEALKHLPINSYTSLAIILLTIGFLAKAAQLPVRIDYQMHPKPAPTPISGYISSVMLKTSPLMLVKLFYIAIGSSLVLILGDISYISALIGVITILMGASFGLLTNSMKRLLIFLTVAEIGYIIAGVSLLNSDGLAGGMMHFISHMFFKDLLFLSAGAIFYKTGIDNLNEIGGLARKMPITFLVFMIAVFSTAGVPLYSGFVSKWIIYHALMEKGYVFLAIFSLLGSIMILLVFVKFLHSAYFGKINKDLLKVEKVSFLMALPMIILAILNIIIGIFPGIILKYVNMILNEFGMRGVEYTLMSVTIKDSTLDMASLTIYLLIAIAIGYFLIVYFAKKTRKTHIFLSGVRDLSEKEVHLKAENYYEPLIHLISSIIKFIKKAFGLKGGYIER